MPLEKSNVSNEVQKKTAFSNEVKKKCYFCLNVLAAQLESEML